MKFSVNINNKKIKILILLLLIILVFLYVIYSNTNIKITNIEYINEELPSSFNNYNIVQISDLHNEDFNDNQKTLISEVKKLKPNMIVITGDLVDASKTNIDVAMNFVNGVKDVAPIYFVSGNHEAQMNYEDLKEKLTDSGVVILEDESTTITKGDDEITLIGASDPAFYPPEEHSDSRENIMDDVLNDLSNIENFQILLSHRPELFDVYVSNNIDLILSGHAHGGQIRLPLIGGLVAPNQGFFPKYDAGLYEENDTAMYVSRGLGNSIIPLRVFNNPEIVNIILKNK